MFKNLFQDKEAPTTVVKDTVDPRALHKAEFDKTMTVVMQRTVGDDSYVAPHKIGLAMDEALEDPIKGDFSDVNHMPIDQLIWFASHSFIGFQNCIIIAQHWLVDKVCTMPARDAVRVGWELKGDGLTSDILKKLRDADKRFKIKKNLVEFERLNRVFGQRVLMFVVESSDPEYYAKPFNIDGVTAGSYKGIVQIDPFWCVPMVENTYDPTSPNFYEPEYYRIGNKVIHRTHLIVNKTCEVPDVMKPTYRYGGVPLPQRIMERVYAAERTANEAPMLAMTKRLDILKLDLLEAMGKKNSFKNIMTFFTNTRDNYGVKVIGQNEEMQRFDTSLADLDAVIMTQYQLVAAIGEMPAVRLLETQPKGFNSTGDYEEASYHERLEGIQEHSLSPVLDRHYQIVMRSELELTEELDIEIVWNPLDSPTETEWAAINLQRAQTGQILQVVGAIDGADERQRIKDDPDSGYMNLETDLLDDEAETGSNPFEDLLNDTVSLDNALFEASTGLYDGAVLITNQTYLDNGKVDEKVSTQDFDVQVSPAFECNGKSYRVILDGHHSLAGAIKAGVTPNFVEFAYSGSDYKNAVTNGRAFDGKGFSNV